jgi:hypothetical protein
MNHRSQVLARGDEVIERVDFRNWHFSDMVGLRLNVG